MPTKAFIVSVSDTIGPDTGDFRDVVEGLRKAGFHVTHILDALGIIIGSAELSTLESLRAIPGVTAVEEERATGPAGT